MVGPAAGGPGVSAVMLVLSESQNTARTIESHLRNRGHALRAAWLTDLEEFEDALKRAAPSLVLCERGLPAVPLDAVIETGTRVAPDVPVILLSPQCDTDARGEALRLGARDCAGIEDEPALEHLEQVCLRELSTRAQMLELRQLRMQLADYEARHRHLMSGTADAIAHVQEGIVEDANPAFAALIGVDAADELIGLPLMDLIAAGERPRVKHHLRQLQKGKTQSESLELPLCRRDGAQRLVTAELNRSEQTDGAHIQVLVRSEITAPAAPMPDGHSYTALFEALADMQSRPGQEPSAIIGLHIDEAARVEERLGLADADEVFATLKELIADRLEMRDRLYRVGAAEWIITVAPRHRLDTQALAESLRKEVSAQLFKTSTFEAHLTATAVAYPLGREATDFKGIVDEVVFEGRRASEQGGNRIVILGPTAQHEQEEKENLRQAARIRKAIEEKRLKLAYQSIASLEGDTHQYFDVFVRMVDETGQELLAREFLPTAEKHGLMRLIDRWVTARSLSLLAKRAESREPASLFVRLSEDTLRDSEGYLAWFLEQTRARPLGPNELVLEIRESVLQNHIRKAKQLATAMAAQNVDIAIDYFGAGHHSSSLLEHVPARFVKFHPCYTQEFGDPNKQKRLRELLETVRQRKAKAIVSQVEDANVMARLWQMGVNFLQGNSVQEPEVVLLSADVHVG